MTRDQILKLLSGHKADLERLGVKSLSLFGSVALGQATAASDVDILVEFAVPVGLFEFIRLKLFLERILGMPVDLVTPDALKESMRETILKEAIRAA
jgi:predicted nucleotidyltransferase